jgi:hypothetical protein
MIDLQIGKIGKIGSVCKSVKLANLAKECQPCGKMAPTAGILLVRGHLDGPFHRVQRRRPTCLRLISLFPVEGSNETPVRKPFIATMTLKSENALLHIRKTSKVKMAVARRAEPDANGND